MIDSQKQLEKLDKILREYDEKIGFKNDDVPQNDLQEILSLDISIIQSLSAEDCWEKSVTLAQYAIYIQRQTNKEKARLKWCNASIMRLCAKEWDNYNKYLPIDVRIETIALNNEAVEKISRIRNHADVKLANLENVAALIKYYSDVMIEGSRTKRKQNERY